MATPHPRLLRPAVCLLVLIGAFSAPSAWSRPEKTDYVKELGLFLNELQLSYAFFETKGITKEWEETRKSLLKKVRRCRKDAQFIELVVEALKCLRDSHARLVDVRPTLKPPQPDFYTGLSFLPATENRVVVMTSTPQLAKTFPPGTEILKINGKKARAYIEARGKKVWKEGGFFSSPQRALFFEYRLPLSGKRGTKYRLEYSVKGKLKKATLAATHKIDGWVHNYHMPEGLRREGKSLWHGELEDGLVYVYLRRFDPGILVGLSAALKAHSDAKGWVVDLRGNTGGGYTNDLKGVAARLPGPMAAIIDAGCVSAGETFARDLVRLKQARLFGSTTAGASSRKKTWTFPSGIATVRFSVGSRYHLDGSPIEYNGISPDEPLEAVPEELREGLNTELVRAVEYLKKATRD